MLSMKKIDPIRHLYVDAGMPVTRIQWKLGVAASTVYKYIKMTDFSPK